MATPGAVLLVLAFVALAIAVAMWHETGGTGNSCYGAGGECATCDDVARAWDRRRWVLDKSGVAQCSLRAERTPSNQTNRRPVGG